MDLDLSKWKMTLTNDIGAKIEDRVDGERKAQHELSGAAHALKQAAKKIPVDLSAHVDRALNEGEIKDGLEALQIAALIKKYLARVGDFLDHLGEVEIQKAIAQGGRVAGMETAMEVVKQFRDDEVARIQKMIDIAKAIENGDEPIIRTSADAARAVHGSLADRRAAAQLERKPVDDMNQEELEQYLMQEQP